jgi:hypothetical protein
VVADVFAVAHPIFVPNRLIRRVRANLHTARVADPAPDRFSTDAYALRGRK